MANYKTERPYQEQPCPQSDLKPSLLCCDTTNTSRYATLWCYSVMMVKDNYSM